MYSNKKIIDRRIDKRSAVVDLGTTNMQRSVLFSEFKENRFNLKHVMIKMIPLVNVNPQVQESIIKKTFGCSHFYFKPQGYDIVDGHIFLYQKTQPLSLQSLIWIHSKQQKSFGPAMMRQFAVRIFQGLARLKSTDIFPQNLKPTNIFLQASGQQRNFVWSQAGLHTVKPSQYYTKLNFQNISKNPSVKIDPFEMEFYSLGIMLVEMMTLQSAQDINNVLRNGGKIYEVKNYNNAVEYYGQTLNNIVMFLLDPPKSNDLNAAIQSYKDEFLDNDQNQPDYEAYQLNQQRMAAIFKDGKNNLLDRVVAQAKDHVAHRNISAGDTFEVLTKLDPGFNFTMNSFTNFCELLRQFGLKLPPHECLFLATYFTVNSTIRYFPLIQMIHPAKDLISSIILKAVENYQSFKQFFQAQTKNKQFWRVQDIKQFLDKIEAPFDKKDVQITVQSWCNAKKTSVKYDQIYKAFKPMLGVSMTTSNIKKPKTQSHQQTSAAPLKGLLQQLKEKQPDLISLFRKHDLKLNWILDFKFQKILQNYLKGDNQIKKKAIAQMWQKGSIPGDFSKQINYVFLLRNLDLYQPIQLLRMILTQVINQSDRDTFFNKYAKGDVWRIQSFLQFNKDQNLDFDQRELKALFRQIDNDGSGGVSSRELFYRLTGLKEFDYKAVVQEINFALKKQRTNIFDLFLQIDQRARMVLSSTSELYSVLKKIGIQLSEDHLAHLYAKFSPTGKFQYLKFLRQFQTRSKLFLESTKAVLKYNYRNDFDKLFRMGLRQGRKKWNRQSLIQINQEMVLGFKQLQIGQIWQELDVNKDGSLNKEEVAAIYNQKVQKYDQLTRQAVQSIHDYKKKQQPKERLKSDTSKHIKTSNNIQNPAQQNVVSQFRQYDGQKFIFLTLEFFKKSERHNGKIQQQNCLQILTNKVLKTKIKDLRNFLQRFQQQQNSRIVMINYLKMIFFLVQTTIQQDLKERSKIKAEICKTMIKAIKQAKSISNQKLMEWCRKKDRMRFSDFEEVFKRIIEVQVYFEDLEEAWNYWEIDNYLKEEDLDSLLQTQEFTGKKDRQSPNERERQRQRERERERLPQKKSGGLYQKNRFNNNMADFINESPSNSSTPYIRNQMSFGQKDSRGSSRKNSFRQQKIQKPSSFGGDDRRFPSNRQERNSPYSNFKPDQKNKEKTARFNDSRQSPLSRQEKIALRQKQEKGFGQKEEIGNNLLKKFQKQQNSKHSMGKTELMQKLTDGISAKGDQYLNQLFSKVDIVQIRRFVGCLSIHYNFSQQQATQLAQHLSTFGKVKLDTLRTQMKKISSPQKTNQKSKQKENRRDRQTRQKSRQNQRDSPSKQRQQRDGRRLIDPRKQKVNIPLVRQQFRQLVNSFAKRFDLSQLQGFFFGDRDFLDRNDFVSKCQSINSNLSGSMCDKMFNYLKPDGQDRVVILSFKLGLSLDQINQDTDDYLPQELQKELRQIFEKADKDHSGFIQPPQIQSLLSSLGFNENIKQIQNYFARVDQNFDNKISYDEFRRFIQDQILPQLSNFQEDQEQLQEILRNNDVFGYGALSPQTFQAVIERYGTKLFPQQIQRLVRAINPQGVQISISRFLAAVRQPMMYSGKVKATLYKIRLRKKVQLRQIQKIFETIASASFVLAYSAGVMHKNMLNISTPYTPSLHQSALFYNDLPLIDIRKVGKAPSNPRQAPTSNVRGNCGPNDIMVQLLFKQLSGVPIPQRSQIKNNIVRRYMNLSFFDLSSDMIKHSIWQVEAQWDPQVQDEWRFNNSQRSVFVKVADYDQRKFQKIVILFELTIAVVQGSRTLQINCGCCNLPLRQLLVPQGKTAKVLKLIAGLPNRVKQIDNNSITKRGGIRGFFGGSIQSQLQIDIIHKSKFNEYHDRISAMPSQVIVGRKALPYLWTYRQYFAQAAYFGGNINTFLHSDTKIMTFLHTLDVPEMFERVWLWWKEKAETKIKTLNDGKKVMKVLLQELSMIVNSKQFELVRRCPSKVIFHHKTLQATRGRLIADALDNVQNWLNGSIEAPFKRKKNYNLSYGPMQMHQTQIPKEHKAFLQTLTRLSIK